MLFSNGTDGSRGCTFCVMVFSVVYLGSIKYMKPVVVRFRQWFFRYCGGVSMRCVNFVLCVMIIVDGIEVEGTKHVSGCSYEVKASGDRLNYLSEVFEK